ncbi:MAG: SGNH/GDSL hydrolase family protein [Burkholderiales bacterium]|nr:SGNH/GDSL hydrolase family protein [Burkholderiales bacterium]
MKARHLMFLAALVTSGPASAAFDSLVVFGDSLSDGGNAYALAGTTFLPFPYAERFSNGPATPEYIAAALGIGGFAASESGGTNYAVGGATTGNLNSNYERSFPSGLPSTLEHTGMSGQVASYLGTNPTFDPATTLFMLWGGPNDLYLAVDAGDNPAAAAATAVSNLATLVTGLAQSGARHFLVPNMVDLGTTPRGMDSGFATELSLLTQGFNAGLESAMALVEAGTGVDITVFDTEGFFADVRANPAGYGFTDATSACISSPAAVFGGCTGYVFFDDIHPTTAAHQVLGSAMAAAVPEPSTFALLAPPLVILAGMAVRRQRRAARA